MSNDPIADLIVRLRNASAVKKSTVVVPCSNLKLAVAERLAATGWIKRVTKKGKSPKKFLEIELAYRAIGTPKIGRVTRVSKSSRRVYRAAREIRSFRRGYGETFFSTSRGVLTSAEAHRAGVGGEVLFSVW